MPTDYTSITVRKKSELDFQKAHIDYQAKECKKVKKMDFFDIILKKFEEAMGRVGKKDVS